MHRALQRVAVTLVTSTSAGACGRVLCEASGDDLSKIPAEKLQEYLTKRYLSSKAGKDLTSDAHPGDSEQTPSKSEKARMPELFEGQAAKYGTTAIRKHILTNTQIPNLDGCYWNGAIHTSTIHPQKIMDAKRRHGLPVDSKLVGQEYFVIPVQRLLDDPKVRKVVHWDFPPPTKKTMLGFFLNAKQLGHLFGEWNTEDFPVVDQEYLDTIFENRADLSPHAEAAYQAWGEAVARGEQPQVLTYNGMPHVLVEGEIDIEGLEIIRVQ